MKRADVSVVIPTVGRPELLDRLLSSLAECDPGPAEVLVVDQSDEQLSSPIVTRYESFGHRLVPCDGSGAARARNVGFRQAAHDVVLCTDDDCTVAPNWVARAVECMTATPDGIVTGRVLPVGDPTRVPSTKEADQAYDYTSTRAFDVLFSNNMASPRSRVLAVGGFDERVCPAEDNDLCYRWLRAGYRLRYEPSLVVWHHDWRSDAELERLAVDYALGQGAVYGKHVRGGDARMLLFAVRDLAWGIRGTATRWVYGRHNGFDWPRGVLRGLPAGFGRGLRLSAWAGGSDR
jgi:GT2 family glycosyltransferase